MTVWNLGSVNADLVYRLPHLPAPGETLAAKDHQKGLGGKGANMSVAVARAGSRVEHIGAIGADGHWMRDRLGDRCSGHCWHVGGGRHAGRSLGPGCYCGFHVSFDDATRGTRAHNGGQRNPRRFGHTAGHRADAHASAGGRCCRGG